MVEQQSLLDRYVLHESLAAGGMGTVHVATDERLNRKVAVKLLKEDLARNPSFVERFRREARAVASLSHPNIANVYDYGVDRDRHFIVMELIDGTDLAEVIRKDAPLSSERATRIAVQLCSALGHAHAAGLIHRDVKPANVIVTNEDRVKVTDFGIARAIGDKTLTATGSMLGTALYLSPEQAVGDRLTPASDIYSAGIVLFEMLTGTLPFAGDSAVAIAMKHVSEDVPRPSEVSRKVPPTLDDVVKKATDRDPRRRYSNGEEMEAALRDATQATDPLAFVPPTAPVDQAEPSVWPIPGDRWNPRTVGRAVLVAFALLFLIAAGALAWRLLSDEPDAASGNRPAQGGGGGNEQPADETPPSPPSPTPTESPAGFVIPDTIIGAPSKDVERNLEGAGFVVVTEEVESDQEKGTVVEVSPPPGTAVFPGDTITLFVSSGENGPPDVPPGQEKKDEDDDD